MVQRMQANTHPDTVPFYHGKEHDYGDACDDPPRCVPVPPIDDDPVARPSYDPPPSHYRGAHPEDDGIQPWDVIDAFGLDYYTGNVLKYLLRAGKKDIAPRLDDLKKARNYINKAIELEEKKS